MDRLTGKTLEQFNYAYSLLAPVIPGLYAYNKGNVVHITHVLPTPLPNDILSFALSIPETKENGRGYYCVYDADTQMCGGYYDLHLLPSVLSAILDALANAENDFEGTPQ